MDDRRFDSLVKSLAGGASRRSVLKGLLGLGGAAAVGGTLLEGPAEAARRPTPTPTTPKCPGVQTWNAGLGKCVCPANLSQCVPNGGPACCNDVAVDPGEPGYSECCDNACCNGTCYGEELCCRTNKRAGGLDPTNRICDTVNGPECCLFSDECCIVDGCCATVCFGGSVGADSCCPVEDFCPGAGESEDLCCTGNTTCCHGGTSGNVCLDLSAPDVCCDEGDCGDPCKICNDDHTCVDRCDPETQVCCTEQAGPGVCLDAECCPGVPCTLTSDNDDEDAGICCDGQCLPSDEVCNGGDCCPGGFCDGNGDCCPPPNVGCNGGVCCNGECDGNGDCCPVGNFHCNGGKCCSVDCDRQGNCPCSDADPCDDGDICCDGTCLSGTDNFTCGDGCCPIADTCCEGECCTGECLRYSEAPDVCCTTLACLEGEARECCPNVEDYKCCGTKGCCTSSACNEEADVCCKDTEFACGLVEGNECCDIETEKCCGGLCIPASECCPSTDGDCCVPLTCADAPQYSCPREFSDGCGQTLDCSRICPEGQSCNDSGWCCGDPGQVCANEFECCSLYCCNGICSDTPCVDCDALCAIGDRCGTVEGCECVCPNDMFCMPNSTFCCPGTSLGTDDNCAYCGDVCGEGTTCESDGAGGYVCAQDCTAACQYRCDVIENGCDCGVCPLTPAGGPQFCKSDGFCCPGTSYGTDDNCDYCGDVCVEGTTCVPNGAGFRCAEIA